jgi:hypothetical protein
MTLSRLALAALIALAFLTGAQAWARSVAIAPIAISAPLQQKLDDKLGAGEAETLRALLTRALDNALMREGLRQGGGVVRVEPEILDAKPNRPTFRELSREPSLSYIGSVSTGGAHLRAMVRGAGGVREVSYRFYTPDLSSLVGPPTTWDDAERAMRVFARRVARAAKEASE